MSGYAYPPEVGLPAASTGHLLAQAVLRAIESARALPREVRVRDGEFKALIEPLAQALGFPVTVLKALPALDFAKRELLKMMRDPGALPRA